jgi:hypothetical protein
MLWTASEGVAHLFEQAAVGQKSKCSRVSLNKAMLIGGVSPKTPPCLLCARLLARQPAEPASDVADVP